MDLLASGFDFLEAPRADGEGNLYFVDDKSVYRLGQDGSIETVVRDRIAAGGILLHADGGIVVSGEDLSHFAAGGERRILFSLDDILGLNDLHADSRGRVYVGSIRPGPPEEPDSPRPGELWRVDGPDRATQLYSDVGLTNGIGFSPDGRVLYHCDLLRQEVIVHDLDDDELPTGRRGLSTAAAPGVPDGLAVDQSGCLWIGMYGGGCVARFSPEGDLQSVIELGAVNVTSLCFGGPDLRDLYIVTCDNTEAPDLKGGIHRLRVDVPGLPAPLARV